MYVNWQYIDIQKHPVLAETGLTSEAAYSEGDVAALLYRDVPEQKFPIKFNKNSIILILILILICTS